MKYEVAMLDDLEEGILRTVEAEGREIILVRWKDTVYALRNVCPHQSASFSAGWARPSLVPCRTKPEEAGANGSQSWGLAIDDTRPVVRCPWHKWEFRLTDGVCSTDARFRVRAYSVAIEDGTVVVDMAS